MPKTQWSYDSDNEAVYADGKAICVLNRTDDMHANGRLLAAAQELSEIAWQILQIGAADDGSVTLTKEDAEHIREVYTRTQKGA